MKIYTLILVSLFIVSCNNKKQNNKHIEHSEKLYPSVSYLDIKLDKSGNLPENPYILEFENGKNRTAAILNGSIYFNELMIEMNN